MPPNCAPSSELPACNRPTCWSDTRWAVSISTSSPASPPYPKFNNHPKLAAGEALVFAYRAYQAATLPPYRISLDRAFNLVSYIDGIWLASAPALSVLTCPGCGCEFIAAVGTVAHPGEPCPFCSHELIKIRVFSDEREVREAYLTEICEKLGAAPVQHIGKLLVVFRPAPAQKPAAATKKPRLALRSTKRSYQN